MNISITMIIPVYNVEKYIVECLESVVKQSIPFDEVIIVNDGSTDNSLMICERYVLKYNYFKLINQENRGLSAARNVGMKHASSQYIMFLDSDDYLRVDTVEILKRILQEKKYEAIYFDADIVGEEKYIIATKNDYDRKDADIDGIEMRGWDYYSKCYPKYYVVSVCMVVYLKEIIDKAGIKFPEGKYYEDNYFSIAFFNHALKVIHISEKLYQRRYRENSITISEYSEKKFLDFVEVSMLIWKELDSINNCIQSEGKEIQLKVISGYCGIILSNYKLCEKHRIMLSDSAKDIFYNVIRQYVSWLNKNEWNFMLMSLPLLNKVMFNLDQFSLYKKQCNMDMTQLIENIVKCQKTLYIENLKNLPLNEKDIKVGIYGMGKHTEGLIAIYEKLIGNIQCNLVFIDSYKNSGNYKNKDIINYKQIDQSFNLIIISSFLYQKEMMECVGKVVPEIRMFTFYDIYNEDIFSAYDFLLPYFSVNDR